MRRLVALIPGACGDTWRLQGLRVRAKALRKFIRGWFFRSQANQRHQQLGLYANEPTHPIQTLSIIDRFCMCCVEYCLAIAARQAVFTSTPYFGVLSTLYFSLKCTRCAFYTRFEWNILFNIFLYVFENSYLTNYYTIASFPRFKISLTLKGHFYSHQLVKLLLDFTINSRWWIVTAFSY